MKAFDTFLGSALDVTQEWEKHREGREINTQTAGSVAFCHGDYQYHNILQGGGRWFIANFEKCLRDDPVRDLYLLLRKLLEKGNWQPALGAQLLETYEGERPLSRDSRADLYFRLA